jgi:hypothetical protein
VTAVTATHRAVAFALALPLSACASRELVPGEWLAVREQPLRPFEPHERCVRLAPGDRLEYTFGTRRPVSFEIRYREGRVVVAPVTRDQVTAERGTFDALTAQEYCLAWESGMPGTLLDYRVRLLPDGARR